MWVVGVGGRGSTGLQQCGLELLDPFQSWPLALVQLVSPWDRVAVHSREDITAEAAAVQQERI